MHALLSSHGPPDTPQAHLVGIAGAGMRALGQVLRGMGWEVSGSDLTLASVLGLAATGIRLYEGHQSAHVSAGTDLLVHSDAVPADNPELRRAARLGIPAYSYFQMLGRLMEGKRGLAVAGTHGKSTTTAMAAHILVQAGRDPTVVCGAAPLGQVTGGRAGGDLMLVEACEYRANFLHLRPAQAVILGIEPDHFDCYPSLGDLERAFARFARLIPPDGLILARQDCPVTRRVTAGLSCRVETYGVDPRADWSARRVAVSDRPTNNFGFEVFRRSRRLLSVQLQVPGRHNVLNALAAAALAWENGASARQIAAGLDGFPGLGRRLEQLGTWGGATLVDDYAHHPTEVSATLETVRRMFPGRRLWCVFQPHQASRTARLLDELADSLQNADMVVVADIFRAREGPARCGEVTAADLAGRVRERSARGAAVSAARSGQDARDPILAGPIDVLPMHGIEEIGRLLESSLAPGDVLVSMGAGDIRRVSDGYTDRFREGRAAG